MADPGKILVVGQELFEKIQKNGIVIKNRKTGEQLEYGIIRRERKKEKNHDAE